MAKRITELAAAPFTGAKVDRAAGTIDGVLICGVESANGRTYPPEVFRRDFPAYEGRPVNCDHGREATVDRRFGWFTGVYPGEDGRPRGRLNCLKSHPMFERVMEAAERNPALFGFSHVAQCETQTRDGREVIEAIRAVESIDLVADPATTNSLFESKGGGRVTITIRKLAESLIRNPKATTKQVERVRRLSEMHGAADVPVDEPAADADPDEAIKGGFRAAILAVVDKAMSGDLDAKEAVKKVKKLLDSHGDATDSGSADTGGSDGGDDFGGGLGESTKRKPAAADPFAVLRECEAAGYRPGGAELKVLAGMDAADRAAFVAEQKAKVPGERPTSGGRNPGGGTAATTRTTEAKEPADVKEFLGRIFG